MKICLSNETLDKIDMSYGNPTSTFSDKSGLDHYRLLTHLSFYFNDSVLIDIGTRSGASALALGRNKSNKVYSFDIRECGSGCHENIEYHTCDLVETPSFWPLIFSAPFISLDTEHDGIFERWFLTKLREYSFKGILYLDDIDVDTFPEMKIFWNEITETKIDITKYGHFSGSGLVLFDPSVEVVME